MLKYKGYTGYVVYDDEARIFHGEVAAIKAVITFQGTTVDEIEQAFKDSVDDYLDWCEERGKELNHIPNAETIASIEASEKGEGVKNFKSIDHLFEDLGI